ncbi:FAD binding domain-containing protein [Roseobacter weihaiensis]|uniref:FAD binding domain-containing protein n=1 Tax=Roseobacter weihaiensis TaxID=2763262 RepID=UPI001D0B77A5|nr:FAD binding domain-containing protein [Roseobacter sp. H9]
MAFERPDNLELALDALKTRAFRVIAGGTDVFPAVQQGQLPSAFLDVTRIAGLGGITRGDGTTRIGAATTWTDIVRAELPAAFDGLKEAAREVGSVQIQNAGTIAGNLCNASPAADGVPPLLALDARVEIASAARGTRVLALSQFIQGVRKTTLAEDELVTAVLIPDQALGTRSAFEKLGSRRYLVISICMTAANILLDAQGRIAQARVAVGSCSAVAQRLPALEADLLGKRLQDVTVSTAHLSPLSPIDDVRGSGTYRLDAAQEQCKRAILRAGAV